MLQPVIRTIICFAAVSLSNAFAASDLEYECEFYSGSIGCDRPEGCTDEKNNSDDNHATYSISLGEKTFTTKGWYVRTDGSINDREEAFPSGVIEVFGEYVYLHSTQPLGPDSTKRIAPPRTLTTVIHMPSGLMRSQLASVYDRPDSIFILYRSGKCQKR